ncbi:AbrB/MazE/SpoVT family DNA-binding domain-containing protein [Aminipila butyrica]|uniref:AbrB/MazE/SpoVT family DNA-binding domain-containing protein n=1 Tax=Aminipila butyrica TaxID=433296 RepID=A0A858BTS1_9FIRM|nr:AbrB/MazE/SpoVT family DNA-binding domain-containing protein [Aminipila butyrica]
MRATGIVRRVDELGRVVLPKELRRVLGIKEGDPMEIFTDNAGEIILKKYDNGREVGEKISDLIDYIKDTQGVPDQDAVLRLLNEAGVIVGGKK